MDLKLKEVAELLQVSETTIRRWVSEDKIPSYKINNQIHFSRDEVQDWVIKNKSTSEKAFSEPAIKTLGQKQYSLTRALHNGSVLTELSAKDKLKLINEAAHEIASRYELDGDVLSDLLLEREKLQATSLGHGIAVPHTRDLVLKGHPDRIIIVFPKKPIEYGSLDKEPVYALFFLLASDDAKHLHLLAKIAHLSSDHKALDLLRKKPSKEKLLEFIKSWESEL